MKTKQYFLSCLSASLLMVSAPSWAEQTDDAVFNYDEDDGKGFSFSIRPVYERDFKNGGEFRASGGF